MQTTPELSDLNSPIGPGLPISTQEANNVGSTSHNTPPSARLPSAHQRAPNGDVPSFDTSDISATKAKPKQKRNKPTLSCLECVERKSKCDRGRPCLACIKRQSACEYTAVANLLSSTKRRDGRANGSRTRFVSGSTTNKTGNPNISSPGPLSPPSSEQTWNVDSNGLSIDGAARLHQRTRSLPRGSPFLFSNLPFSQSSPSNVFGIGSQHPFSNYWTCQGGLPEVITVLPSKEQADILIARYFETVDPVYPFIHRRTFYSDYEVFWALPQDKKGDTDASLIALHYAMYALGTQFMPFPSYAERSQTAEFYCSAANQALRVYSYLNRTSMHAIQAMLLMAYFLMNDNHASDAYAWAGIHLRQTYAMRLHRDPELVVPDASIIEKQQRRKLWQAVFIQDTFITVLLKMPPSATHSDVPVESLADENELNNDGIDVCLGSHSRVENLMSINVIAPQVCETLPPPQPHHIVDLAVMRSDTAYMRSMWYLGNLVQENLSSPCSLSMPIANSPKHKDTLIAAFTRLYQSFPSDLIMLDYDSLKGLLFTRPRAVRQNLFLNSCYHHCLMLLHASENMEAGVETNVIGALEAAHEALWAFFKLWDLFAVEAAVWWAFHHRAFEESLLVANLLTMPVASGALQEPIFAKAKEDVAQMLEIMERYGGNMEMHVTRKTALHSAFQRISNPD